MKREAYAAARTVSPAVHDYFARRLQQASGDPHLAPLPSAEAIEAIIDASFWASLRREEGYVPRISIAYLSPEDIPGAHDALRFERPLGLIPAALTRIAPAVERPGVHRADTRLHVGHRLVFGLTDEQGQNQEGGEHHHHPNRQVPPVDQEPPRVAVVPQTSEAHTLVLTGFAS